MKSVRLQYHRPPDRTDTFEQRLVTVDTGCHVTLLDAAVISKPMVVDGRTVLEAGSPIVWFTFEDAWHEIGRFHTAAGEFTGYYANTVLPVTFHDPLTWECTDMFLDVWLGADGLQRTLDEDELAEAVAKEWVTAADAERAQQEVRQIRAGAAAGTWPPLITRAWTVERAREALANNA